MKFVIFLLLTLASLNAFSEAGFLVQNNSVTSFGAIPSSPSDQYQFTGAFINPLPGSSSLRRTQAAFNALEVKRDSDRSSELRRVFGAADCAIVSDSSGAQSVQAIENYCASIAGNQSACSGNGSTIEQRCQVDCAIKPRHTRRIAGEILNLGESQKKQACVDRVKSVVISERPAVTPPHLQLRGLDDARSSVIRAVEDKFNQRATILNSSSLRCQSASGQTCDSFVGTALEASSITEVASLLSVEYTRTRNGLSNLIAGRDGDCEKCMENKYKALAGDDVSGADFDRAKDELKQKAIVKLAARKANEAISNYLKFIERNDFIQRFAESPKETCELPRELNSLSRRRCPHAGAILDTIKAPLPRIQQGSNLSVLQNVLSAYQERMFERKISSPGTCSGEYDFDLFQRSKLTMVGDPSVAARIGSGANVQNLWLDAEAMRKIEGCGNQNLNCFVDIMAETKARNTRTNVAQEKNFLLSHLALSPFLRTMLSSKMGIQHFYQMDGLSASGAEKVEDYLKRNEQKIVDAAAQDSKDSCLNIGLDLQKALCTTSSNYAENYTADELRSELAGIAIDELGDKAPEGNLEFFVQMGMTCSILTDSRSHQNNQTPAVASMSAADRIIPALPFAGLNAEGFSSPVDTYATAADEGCPAAPRGPMAGIDIYTPMGLPTTVGGVKRVCKAEWEDWTPENSSLLPCFGDQSPMQLSPDPYGFGLAGSMNPLISPFGNLGNRTQSGFGGMGSLSFSNFNLTNTTLGVSQDNPLSNTNEIVVTGNPLTLTKTDESIKSGDLKSFSISETTRLSQEITQTPQNGEMVSTNAANAFASLSGGTSSAFQTDLQIQVPGASKFINAYQPQIQMPQQIEAANVQVGSTLRREETLVRQESELLRKVDTQSIENRELREAVTQLRREMTSMASQNAQLLPALQRMVKARGGKPAEDDEEEKEDESEPVVTEATPKTKSSARSRAPASGSSARSAERSGGQAQGGSEGFSRPQGPAIMPVGQAGGVNIVQDPRGQQVIGGAAGVAANVTVSAGGARAGGGMERLVTRFTPSSPVTRQALAAPGGAVVEVGADEKTQLVMEFLDYVKDFPLYRNGAYLSESNDTITVDYGGKELVVKLDQIADSRTRNLVQERIITQRMNLNQQLRQARLTELRRLLAEASDGL